MLLVERSKFGLNELLGARLRPRDAQIHAGLCVRLQRARYECLPFWSGALEPDASNVFAIYFFNSHGLTAGLELDDITNRERFAH